MPDSSPFATKLTLSDAIRARNALLVRAPEDLFTKPEAGIYLDCSESAVDGLVATRQLRPDGRGTKRRPLFRKATLDAFLVARVETDRGDE